MSEFVLYLCKVMEEKRISSPLFCAIPFYKARNAGFILIVTCAGLFCTDAFVKTDNRNQYSSCSGA